MCSSSSSPTIQLAAKEVVPAGEQKLIICDTDGGVDDMMALAILCRGHNDPQINVRLVAITCVHGNAVVDTVIQNVRNCILAIGGAALEVKIVINTLLISCFLS
jgi:inosine-uridine nucleoside N-ribohydrolase